LNFSEIYEADEEGFFDIMCLNCDGTDFVIQANTDGTTLRIICFKCKRETAFQVEKYMEGPEEAEIHA